MRAFAADGTSLRRNLQSARLNHGCHAVDTPAYVCIRDAVGIVFVIEEDKILQVVGSMMTDVTVDPCNELSLGHPAIK